MMYEVVKLVTTSRPNTWFISRAPATPWFQAAIDDAASVNYDRSLQLAPAAFKTGATGDSTWGKWLSTYSHRI